MPNWVKSRVIAKNSEILEEWLLNEKGEVDFSILKPMPSDLKISSGSNSFIPPGNGYANMKVFVKDMNSYDNIFNKLKAKYSLTFSQEYYVKQVKKDKELMDQIYKFLNTSIEDNAINYIKGFYNWMKYGYVDWYSWSLANWGTKWNANSTEYYIETGVLEFQTAWCMPYEIFAKLAEHTDIRVEYADEDLGNNCGIVDFYKDHNGNVQSSYLMDESLELACDCWGYPTMDVFDENGDQVEDENDPRVIKANREYFETQEVINKLMSREALEKIK